MLKLYVFVKLSRNQSWVNLLFSVPRELILDSIFSIACSWFLILDSRRNRESRIAQESRLATDYQLSFEWCCNCLNGWFFWWNNVWLINWVAWLVIDRLNGWLTVRQTVKFMNWLAHFLNGWYILGGLMNWLTFILLMYLQVFVIFLEIACTIQLYCGICDYITLQYTLLLT